MQFFAQEIAYICPICPSTIKHTTHPTCVARHVAEDKKVKQEKYMCEITMGIKQQKVFDAV